MCKFEAISRNAYRLSSCPLPACPRHGGSRRAPEPTESPLTWTLFFPSISGAAAHGSSPSPHLTRAGPTVRGAPAPGRVRPDGPHSPAGGPTRSLQGLREAQLTGTVTHKERGNLSGSVCSAAPSRIAPDVLTAAFRCCPGARAAGATPSPTPTPRHTHGQHPERGPRSIAARQAPRVMPHGLFQADRWE